ncbi:MAG: hypothetical protein R2752_08205 [Vicinamibacterales bacterium]
MTGTTDRAAGRVAARSRRLAIGVLAMAGVTAACVDSLPAEDLRIATATPVAKLSVGLLWKDYQDDPSAARAKYRGRAVEVSGLPTAAPDAAAEPPVVVFAQDDQHAVRAILLTPVAGAGPAVDDLVTGVKVGERLTLKCFCEGLVDGQLVLRSCIRPVP